MIKLFQISQFFYSLVFFRFRDKETDPTSTENEQWDIFSCLEHSMTPLKERNYLKLLTHLETTTVIFYKIASYCYKRKRVVSYGFSWTGYWAHGFSFGAFLDYIKLRSIPKPINKYLKFIFISTQFFKSAIITVILSWHSWMSWVLHYFHLNHDVLLQVTYEF